MANIATSAPHSAQTRPGSLVSVVMSNFNGSAHLEKAIISVLNQSHSELELIVVDDASEDSSLEIIQRLASSDPRLRSIALDTNRGPAGARNAGLEAAKGHWIAIVDADDLIHPQRIERMLAAAQDMGADAIADDLLCFGSARTAGKTLLEASHIEQPQPVAVADLVRSDSAIAGFTSFGYLKPLIRRGKLRSLRYDEDLRLGEDFDLYFRLLIAGANFVILPDPTYLYRRHSGSVSHRLSVSSLQRLLHAHTKIAKLAANMAPKDAELVALLNQRRARLERAMMYQSLVSDTKSAKVWHIIRRLGRRPALLLDLTNSLIDRWRPAGFVRHNRSTGSPKTIVLASPDQIDLIDAPPTVVRVPVNPSDWVARRIMASKLAKLASTGPVDVIADGPAGLDGLGYLPNWRSTRLALSKKDVGTAKVPRHVVLDVT
ncbi:glycosyltransferase family 2 protein [uncultured Ruegeria sp.]|uniref:glycosyltransferase family 2 protein n=2 Tax=uncultured Ruegeria sp. TaxID=259304 RepID=UPI00262208F6|nr:glycosyltransferase family 2 protein [uncultured Ruegeria sp.]